MHHTPTAAHAAGHEDAPLRLVGGGTISPSAAWPLPDLRHALRGQPTPSDVLAGFTPLQRARHEQQVDDIKREFARHERANRAKARAALEARLQAPAQEALL